MGSLQKIAYFANTSWFLANFRLADMEAARDLGLKVYAIAPEDEYSENFEKVGIEFVPLYLKRRNFSPVGKWRTVRELRKIYETHSIDLVHLFTLEAIIAGNLASGRRGPKTVQSVAGMGFAFSSDQFSKRLIRAGLRPLLRRCLRRGPVIAENEMDRGRIREIIGSGGKYPVERLPGGGIDVGRFSPGDEDGSRDASAKVRFLSAGRLIKDKGAGLFAEAARCYEGPPAEFLLAGMPDQGTPGSYKREEVEAWNEIPGFQWLGNVSDMPELLRSVDLLVHPTFYGEGLPRIIMEAEASGLPIICSNIPACTETVKDGVNGWVLDERDPRKLARIMENAASLPNERKEMGARNRQYAVIEFDQKEVIRKTLEIYRWHFPDWNPSLKER